MRFKDLVCIVTGGGSGIGRAACQPFAAEGAKVLVVGRNPEHGGQTVESIASSGGQAAFAKCDVANSADIQAAIQAAVGRWGRIDVLVNNAAMMTFLPVVDLPERDWDRVLAVNTTMLWENPNVKSGKERIQGAVGEPQDIAAAICFLASQEARFINGTTLIANGGRCNCLPSRG